MRKYIKEEIKNISSNIKKLQDLLTKFCDKFYMEVLELLRFSKKILLGDYPELEKENVINKLSAVYVNISTYQK